MAETMTATVSTDATDSTSESELEMVSEIRSPDISFESEAVGIPVDGNESVLDISLRVSVVALYL